MSDHFGPNADFQIGKFPGGGQGSTLPQSNSDPRGLVIPGSEDDKSVYNDPSESPSKSGDLDDHKSSAELDHPINSVKLKHLENSIRAILEGFQFNNSGILEIATRTAFTDGIDSELSIYGALTATGDLSIGESPDRLISDGTSLTLQHWNGSSWDNSIKLRSVNSAADYDAYITGSLDIGGSYSGAGQLTLRNAAPTIYLKDTTNNVAMLHCNSDKFYILRGGTDSSTWTQVNSAWPAYWDLTNNNMFAGGNIYGRAVNGAHDILYRWGGMYFTWDADSYGTNFNHSITSTFNGSWGDHITLNSYGNVRINIDSNSNGANEFSVGYHTTGSANWRMRVDESGRIWCHMDYSYGYQRGNELIAADASPVFYSNYYSFGRNTSGKWEPNCWNMNGTKIHFFSGTGWK